ncbi:unnamed protein product [Dicrocoelium dendriticum]|nr:unnamed protein product [Dicrocoelium dendriticum]
MCFCSPGCFDDDVFDYCPCSRVGLSGFTESMDDKQQSHKCYEDHCRSLASELEYRELQLEQLKSHLLSRIYVTESHMKKLVQLRDDESIKAERAATKLRAAVNKLQMRYECEKQQLHDTLRSVGESANNEISHLKTLLKQNELDREQLQSKLKFSDSNTVQLNEEIARLKSEASQFASRLSQLLSTNSDLSSNLTKLKSAHQKASARAEEAAKQIGDLRKQLDQANDTLPLPRFLSPPNSVDQATRFVQQFHYDGSMCRS